MKTIDKTQAPEMFNRIAKRYDFVNRVISFGVDKRWRKRLVRFAAGHKNAVILDLATGTGDVVIDLLKGTDASKIIGIDPSEGMIAEAREKIVDKRVDFQIGDAQDLTLKNKSVDVITMSFGIRNVPNTLKGLKEMKRVLKPRGEVLILEFSLPKNKLFGAVYVFYLRRVLPIIGGILSGDRAAYSYLNKTIESFPYGEDFAKMMRTAGFKQVVVLPQTFGIATIYRATL